MTQSIGPRLRKNWRRLSSVPFGKWLFSRLVGLNAPFTGAIGANVLVLEPGHCVVSLKQRRKVRNHLKSVHAIALANLAEMSTGLALMNSLPENTRGILTGIQVSYPKKAKGVLTAECHCSAPKDNREQELQIEGQVKDETGDIVASAMATWLIGPGKKG